jgi:hypothetical protein
MSTDETIGPKDTVPVPSPDLKAQIEKAFGEARAVIQPAIPEHIAKNILEFLRRVDSKGMEAIAWVEAYQHVQSHVKQPQGVPFGGLPPK